MAITSMIPMNPVASILPNTQQASGINALGGGTAQTNNLSSILGGGSGTSAAGSASASGGDFVSQLGSAIDSLQGTQSAADTQALSVANGTGNIADYMVTAEQANLATQLTTAIVSKATGSFNMIMNMSV